MDKILLKNNIFTTIRKKLFPFYKKKEIKKIFKILESGKVSNENVAMFVGGCVRNYIDNQEIDDIDMCTIYTTDQLKEKFKNTGIKLLETGIKHGSVTLLSGNLKIEITTLRKDKNTDGRHAEIETIRDWKEDSNRRDFTINAIYLDKNGKIFDPQSGVSDLKNKILKFIGDPEIRIEEDYLRIIRYLRFATQYDCEIDQSTLKAVKVNLNGIKNISKERILSELFKIFKLSNIEKIYSNNIICELFLLIFPELKYVSRLKEWKLIKNFDLNENFILATILLDKTNNHEYFCHKYKTSNEIKKYLNSIQSVYVEICNDKNFLNKNFKKNIYHYGKPTLKQARILSFLDQKKVNFDKLKRDIEKIETISLPKFPYDGKYLINKGYNEGKEVGELLKLLENSWIESDFKLSAEKEKLILKK